VLLNGTAGRFFIACGAGRFLRKEEPGTQRHCGDSHAGAEPRHLDRQRPQSPAQKCTHGSRRFASRRRSDQPWLPPFDLDGRLKESGGLDPGPAVGTTTSLRSVSSNLSTGPFPSPGNRSVALPVEVEYTRNQPMVPLGPFSCSRSPNRLLGRFRKGLGDRSAPLHPLHHARERMDRGSIGAGGWRRAVSLNQVLSDARDAAGADRPSARLQLEPSWAAGSRTTESSEFK
jgi:hypothetical protein